VIGFRMLHSQVYEDR